MRTLSKEEAAFRGVVLTTLIGVGAGACTTPTSDGSPMDDRADHQSSSDDQGDGYPDQMLRFACACETTSCEPFDIASIFFNTAAPEVIHFRPFVDHEQVDLLGVLSRVPQSGDFESEYAGLTPFDPAASHPPEEYGFIDDPPAWATVFVDGYLVFDERLAIKGPPFEGVRVEGDEIPPSQARIVQVTQRDAVAHEYRCVLSVRSNIR